MDPEIPFDDPADQLSEWFQMVMMWPFTILVFTLKLIGRFSKVPTAPLLTVFPMMPAAATKG